MTQFECEFDIGDRVCSDDPALRSGVVTEVLFSKVGRHMVARLSVVHDGVGAGSTVAAASRWRPAPKLRLCEIDGIEPQPGEVWQTQGGTVLLIGADGQTAMEPGCNLRISLFARHAPLAAHHFPLRRILCDDGELAPERLGVPARTLEDRLAAITTNLRKHGQFMGMDVDETMLTGLEMLPSHEWVEFHKQIARAMARMLRQGEQL